MPTVSIQNAQANLPDLIHNLSPGAEVVITENSRPVAKLVSEPPAPKPGLRPPPGLGKGRITALEARRMALEILRRAEAGRAAAAEAEAKQGVDWEEVS